MKFTPAQKRQLLEPFYKRRPIIFRSKWNADETKGHICEMDYWEDQTYDMLREIERMAQRGELK